MAKGGNTVKIVRELVEPFAKELGLEIWDVRFLKEGADWYLRIFIDKDGGVSIDDCVDLTHAINGPLDEADPIEQAYFLEVSSPGIERELRTDEHISLSIGQKVKAKLFAAKNGSKEFCGMLSSFDGDNVVITVDGNDVSLSKSEISKLETVYFDE